MRIEMGKAVQYNAGLYIMFVCVCMCVCVCVCVCVRVCVRRFRLFGKLRLLFSHINVALRVSKTILHF